MKTLNWQLNGIPAYTDGVLFDELFTVGGGLYDESLEKCLEKLRSTDAKVILIERQAPQGLVAALESVGYSVARIDIMSTRREEEGFEGYVEAQRENAAAIRAAYDAAAREGSN